MSTVLASALPEKPVLSADGRKIGTVHNLTIDPRSGDFETLLVAPGPDGVDPEEILPDTIGSAAVGRRTDAGEESEPDAADRGDETIRIPGDAVAAVGDQVIVDLSREPVR